MQKLIANRKQIQAITYLWIIISSFICRGQELRKDTFDEIVRSYGDLNLPIVDLESLKKQSELDIKILNQLLFDLQKEKAKHYVRGDTLSRITSYGLITDEPFIFSTFRRVNGDAIDFDTVYVTKAYALGGIELDRDHMALVTRVIDFEVDYIDIYLFQKSTGILKSLINAFEASFNRNGFPEEGYEAIYNASSITEDKQIKWHQERYGVTTDRIFDVSPDGYFRVIYQKSEGEFEY